MNRKRPNRCTDCGNYVDDGCKAVPSIKQQAGFPFPQTLCQWFKKPVVEKANPWATPRF